MRQGKAEGNATAAAFPPPPPPSAPAQHAPIDPPGRGTEPLTRMRPSALRPPQRSGALRRGGAAAAARGRRQAGRRPRGRHLGASGAVPRRPGSWSRRPAEEKRAEVLRGGSVRRRPPGFLSAGAVCVRKRLCCLVRAVLRTARPVLVVFQSRDRDLLQLAEQLQPFPEQKQL